MGVNQRPRRAFCCRWKHHAVGHCVAGHAERDAGVNEGVHGAENLAIAIDIKIAGGGREWSVVVAHSAKVVIRAVAAGARQHHLAVRLQEDRAD